MRSLTTWSRLEPTLRDAKMTDSLRAGVRDPLWLLGRQWQLGEFQGEDAGSPVNAELSVRHDRVSRYVLGATDADDDGSVQRYDRDTPPLEAIVERQPREDDLRRAAEAGDYFLQLLAATGVSGSDGPLAANDFASEDGDLDLLIRATGEDADDETRRYAMLVSGRTIDGDQLYDVVADRLAAGETLPTPDGVPTDPNDTTYATYKETVKTYRAWYESTYGVGDDSGDVVGTAWKPERLEHEFAVAAGPDGDGTRLAAEEYRGGRLDWYSFDARDGDLPASSEPKSESPRTTPTHEFVPTSVHWHGMPAPRWWQFEDARVTLGDVETTPEDLSRLLLLEFALIHGNDWFEVPVDAPVGSLTRVESFTVTDTFNRQSSVEPTEVEAPPSPGEDRWRMYTFNLGDGETGLFLPPTLGDALESDPVEDVLFVRDEALNAGWAIENAVEGPLGLPLDRHELDQQDGDGDDESVTIPDASDAEVSYRLSTDMPDYWLPLLPEQAGDGESIRFRLGRLLTVDAASAPGPEGQLLQSLAESNDRTVPEEEVPRAGTSVTRSYQLARWFDGSTHFWTGRSRGPGTGSASSSLQFDHLADPTASQATDLSDPSDG